jgi:hypothetical protein
MIWKWLWLNCRSWYWFALIAARVIALLGDQSRWRHVTAAWAWKMIIETSASNTELAGP